MFQWACQAWGCVPFSLLWNGVWKAGHPVPWTNSGTPIASTEHFPASLTGLGLASGDALTCLVSLGWPDSGPGHPTEFGNLNLL